MKKIIVSTALLISVVSCWAQIEYNQVKKRLSKKEFKELKNQKDKFIPVDLKSTKVLIVRCSKESFEKLQRNAHLKSLVGNGFDTTSIDDNYNFVNYAMKNSESYYLKYKDQITDFATKGLLKKGIKSVFVDEGHEKEYSTSDFRYFLKMNVISTMRDPQKAWYSKVTYFPCRQVFRPDAYYT